MTELDDDTRQRFRQFFDDMAKQGVARIEAGYSGSDDEGWINDVVLLNRAGLMMVKGSEQSTRVEGLAVRLLEPALNFLNEALSCYSPGWENSEGGAGTVEVDIARGTAHFDHGLFGEPELLPQPFDIDLGSGNVDIPPQRWRRVVVYEVDAPTLEEAEEAWDADGPELADRGRVELVDFGDFTGV